MISIIVTNYKTPELLKICLKAIKKSCQPLTKDILVVDSETSRETAFVVNEVLPEAKLLPFKENVGYSRLVNRGIKESQGEYIFIINSDIIVSDGSLDKMLDFLEKNPKVGLLGPQLLNFNGTIQDSCFRIPTIMSILARRTFLGKLPFGKKSLDNFLMKDFDHQHAREVEWVMGSALFFKRQSLDRVGLFDERFFMYFEDVDWCRRFWQAGLKVVYFPEAKMHHYHLRVSRKSGTLLDIFTNQYTWIHIFSAAKYFFKHGFKNRVTHNL